MPDAGIFLDHADIYGQKKVEAMFQGALTVWFDGPNNITGSDASCLSALQTEPWRCWFSQYLIAFSEVGCGLASSFTDRDLKTTIRTFLLISFAPRSRLLW